MKTKQKSKQVNFFDQDEMLNHIYLRAQRDGLRPSIHTKKENFMKKTWFKGLLTLAVATSFIFVFMTQVMAPENTPESVISTVVDKAVVAYVSIDINPSFEVSVLEDDTVSAIEQLNEDALSIDVSDLIGQDISVVLEAIVTRATEAGFINTEDLLEDYVLVTTVMDDDTNIELHERLTLKLQTKIHESEMLNTMNVVQMKSDMTTKLEAEGANVPVGLYVINGQVIQEDGTYLSAREFFSNSENLNQLKNTYQITVNESAN